MTIGDLDVRTIMGEQVAEEVEVPSIIYHRIPSADPNAAFERLGCLKYTLEKLERDINATNVQNTEESWHRAYQSITKAFADCIAEEKRIICNN